MNNFGRHERIVGRGVKHSNLSKGGCPPNVYTDKLHNQSGEKVTDHWPDYLKGGYFDADGHLRIEYVSREAGQYNGRPYGVEPLVRAMCADRTGLTMHQVRRYFGHCRAIEMQLKSSDASWAAVLPDIKKLDIAAADGAAKQPPKIPSLFCDFINQNVAKIKTKKDFLEGFIPHFEALVGFGQAYFKKERN